MATWVMFMIGLLVGAWVVYGLLLWSLQEAMIYPAPGGIPRASLDQAAVELGVEPVDLVARYGTRLYGWHRRAGGDRALMYLHGNAETVATSLGLQRMLANLGWDVAIVAYRGYPGSQGRPSEAGTLEDARAMWDYLTVAQGIAAERIVLHGKSLGGGVAVGLAADHKPGALVVESTFTSMLALAQVQAPLYPVERLLRSPYRSDERAGRIDCPTLVLHGAQDELIPVSHGRQLATLIPRAKYVESPWLGHNDSLVLEHNDSRDAYLALLDAVAGTDAP